MLCDQINSWVLSANLPPEVAYSYSTFATKLGKAHRFVLDREAVMTIHSISESSPRKFIQALNVCRLPFPSMWVEFAFKDREDWIVDARTRGLVVNSREDASPPSKLGFYLEQQDKEGRIIFVIPCWNHPTHDTVSICHLALVINTDDETIDVRNLASDDLDELITNTKDKKNPYHRWMTDPFEIEAAVQLDARIKEEIPVFMRQLWAAVAQLGSKNDLDRLFDMARFDLASEWRFVLSLLTVLNSRNVIKIEDGPDLRKLNKARAHKGALPLMTHRYIKLNMSRVQKRRMGGSESRDIQKHAVKGHWKMRSSGLFWWMPHHRGNVGKASVTTTMVKG